MMASRRPSVFSRIPKPLLIGVPLLVAIGIAAKIPVRAPDGPSPNTTAAQPKTDPITSRQDQPTDPQKPSGVVSGTSIAKAKNANRPREVVAFMNAKAELDAMEFEIKELQKTVVPSNYPESIKSIKVGESSRLRESGELRIKTDKGFHLIINKERYLVRGLSPGNFVTGDRVSFDGFFRRLENDDSSGFIIKVIEWMPDPTIEPRRKLDMAERLQEQIPAKKQQVANLKAELDAAKQAALKKALDPIMKLAQESFAEVATDAKNEWVEKMSKPVLQKIQDDYSCD